MASSAVPIPKRKQAIREPILSSSGSASPTAHHGMSSVRSSFSSSASHSPSALPSSPPGHFGKIMAYASSRSDADEISPRRPSLMGSSLSRSEYTVINLGHSDGPPRLVTCVKSSQGFDWNQELFLPSYAAYESHDLEHKPDPVFDIILTDEEAAAMLP